MNNLNLFNSKIAQIGIGNIIDTKQSKDTILNTIKFMEDTWIPALRNGRYSKAKFSLRTGQGSNTAYCCLGLACNLVSRHRWTGENKGVWGKDGPCISLSTTHPGPLVGLSNIVFGTLADLNDSLNKSFYEIADFVENYLIPAMHRYMDLVNKVS